MREANAGLSLLQEELIMRPVQVNGSQRTTKLIVLLDFGDISV